MESEAEIETGFLCILCIQESEGGGGEKRLFDSMALGTGVYSGEGAYYSVGAYSRKCGVQNMTKKSRYISTTFIPNFNTRCK